MIDFNLQLGAGYWQNLLEFAVNGDTYLLVGFHGARVIVGACKLIVHAPTSVEACECCGGHEQGSEDDNGCEWFHFFWEYVQYSDGKNDVGGVRREKEEKWGRWMMEDSANKDLLL